MQGIEVKAYADEDLCRRRPGLRATLLADMGSLDEAYAELDDKERIYVEEEAEEGIAYTYARRAYVAARAGAPHNGVVEYLRTSHSHAIPSDSGHKSES